MRFATLRGSPGGAAEPESSSPVDPKGALWDLGLEIWRTTAAQERQGWPDAESLNVRCEVLRHRVLESSVGLL